MNFFKKAFRSITGKERIERIKLHREGFRNLINNSILTDEICPIPQLIKEYKDYPSKIQKDYFKVGIIPLSFILYDPYSFSRNFGDYIVIIKNEHPIYYDFVSQKYIRVYLYRVPIVKELKKIIAIQSHNVIFFVVNDNDIKEPYKKIPTLLYFIEKFSNFNEWVPYPDPKTYRLR